MFSTVKPRAEQIPPEDSGPSTIQTIAVGVAIVVVAGLVADLVLWPRDQLPPVAAVDQHEYFSQVFINRAEAFRGLQSWLAIVSALLLVALPLLLALYWPRGRAAADGSSWRARWSDRRSGVLFGRGGAGAAALVGAGVAAIALLATLPFELIGFLRARDYGLAKQDNLGWLWNWTLAALLTILGVALLAILARALIRRLGRGWWAAFGVCLIALALVFEMLTPIVIEPLFADFTKVPAGQLRSEVEAVASKSKVHAGPIYTVDAASRTTGVNAYVTGIGSTKRVVIYDTLLTDLSAAERTQVIAHEFGHARHRDVIAGLVWFGFVAMLAMFAIDLMAQALARRREVELGSPAGVAMILAAAMLAIAVSQPAANAWSRAIEARADDFALRVTQQPNAAIDLERRLTTQNLSRPQPPAVQQFLFGTHPTPIDRIGRAVTVKHELVAGRREPAP